MNRGDMHVLIIGAGIGGLTAALALQREGFRVSVFEQAPELGEVGAGMTLFRNANIAFDYLGPNDSIAATSEIPDIGALKDYKTGEVLHTTSSLRSTPKGTAGSDWKKTEFDLRHIHRADLHEILITAVKSNDPDAIHLDHTFLTSSQDNDSVTARFKNGFSVSAQVLVGCDGIRSNVRQDLLGKDDPEFLNYVAWRGLVPLESLPEGLVTPDTGVLRGKNKSFTRYKIRDGSLVNYVAFARRDDWTEDGWCRPR